MKRLIVLAFIGLIAQLVDGSLGMAYGVTSTSMLLMFGIAPAVASASVHMAEVVTTAASGISHLKFGNVDKQAMLKLIIPGSIGAFVGACFLSNLPGDLVKPYVSLFLLALGFFVIYRFLFKNNTKRQSRKQNRTNKQYVPLGLVAGFFDATGGGGWGPVATPVLLTRDDMEPRKVIGTVDTSEFAIAVSSTLGFMISLGWEQFNFQWVLALMVGGIIAAPIAAWLVKILPTNLLGTLVGGLIIITNIRTILGAMDASQTLSILTYSLLITLWAAAIVYVVWKLKKVRYSEQITE